MGRSKMRVALAQMEVVAGQPSTNFETMKGFIERAKKAKADIVVFPEMCIGGYLLADKWNDEDFVSYLESFNDRVREMSDGIGIVFGNVGRSYLEPEHPGKDWRPARYNMAFFAQNGAWVPRIGDAPAGRFVKLPSSDDRMADAERYFTSAVEDVQYYPDQDFEQAWLSPFAFQLDGETVIVCLQLGEGPFPAYSVEFEDEREDGTCHVCDLFISICASPWYVERDCATDGCGCGCGEDCDCAKDRDCDDNCDCGKDCDCDGDGDCAKDCDCGCGDYGFDDQPMPVLAHVNCVGMQNTGKNVLAFDGGSAVFPGDGGKSAIARDDFEEQLLIADIDLDTQDVSRVGKDEFTGYYKGSEKALDAIVSSLRRFDEQVFPFHPKWVIGLSGGIDSSVTAALMHLAFGGSERIIGYNLATRYNSDTTKANAYNLAQALGIRLVNGSIEALVQATGTVLDSYGYPQESVAGLAQENIQARLRGHMLSTFAAIEGGVIMNNGNKVECALGYATLYGDAIGAIAPIGDVTKVRLFELARSINRRLGKEVIPENLIPEETEDGYRWETMPSAELKDAQKDPMKWFYHDWLVECILDDPGHTGEDLLQAYLEGSLLDGDMCKWMRFYGLDDPRAFVDDLEWVFGQIRKSVFKRIQAPPAITVTRGAFGIDYHENQVNFEPTPRYLQLKEEVLSQSV